MTHKLVFGMNVLCPKCVKHDRRGLLYAAGWRWWREENLLAGMIVIETEANGWCKIVCQECGGRGVVERLTPA